MSFINKVVLVTGASSGIGEAIALHFAKFNARLALVDSDIENLKRCSAICEKLSRAKVLIIVGDISKDELARKAIEDTVKQYSRLDVLVNCSGIFGAAGLLDTNVMQIFDRVMDINFRSVVNMTSAAAPALIETKGCIVNISSVTSDMALENLSAYGASKAALVHFNKSASLELGALGVRVNAVSPGPVNTTVINVGLSREDNELLWANKVLPVKRNVKTEEIAELVAFLASDKAIAMTGQNYTLDCGYSIR